MISMLHISDLHLVANPQWNNMKQAILYSVREKLKYVGRGEKLLIITGDFHNFVQNDYIHAEQFLQQLFEAMDIEPSEDVFVIPGNHDISTPASIKEDRDLAITAIKHEPAMLQSGLNKLLCCYDDYIKFVQKLKIYPSDCDKLPAQVHVRAWRNKLNLLHLNTTLIADGNKNDQITDTNTATSDEIRQQLRINNSPCIAIGHNSYFDLLDKQRVELSALFYQEYISAYLCGDRHKRNTVREENRIILTPKLSTITIPNIVSYRSSTDENDIYSDFGMIWHNWDEASGHVRLEYLRWDSQNQAELQPDGIDYYDFRKKTISAPSTSIKTNNDIESCWLQNDTILAKGKVDVKKFHIRKFLHGGRCEWNLAFSDKIVLRDIVEGLYKRAIDGGIYALVGPGGEGKTTILRQLCAKMILRKIPIFYYRGYGNLELPQNIPEQSIFIVDNPPNNAGFKRFLDQIIEDGQTLILGARHNEWNLLKNHFGISDRDVLEIPLETLTKKECWHFADCIKDNLDCAWSKKEIKDLFLNNSYGFLYASMLMVSTEKNSLEEIAREIIENLYERSHKAFLLLAHIVLSEWYEAPFSFAQFKQVCNKLSIPPKEASRALYREVSLNGELYQTRHEIISKLFYKEIFSDAEFLLLDEMDDIIENLILFYLDKYQNYHSGSKVTAWNSIMQLSGGLQQASLKTQKYLITIILEEIKSQIPKTFNQLPSYIGNEEVQLLFYQQCFEKNYIYSNFLIKWCDLLLKRGTPWSIDEPYSPAWIMREACMKYNTDSVTWMAWAQFETQHGQIGDYDIENSARWIFHEACMKFNPSNDIWLAWAQFETLHGQIGDYDIENSARWIFHEACIKFNASNDTWMAWAQLEAQQGHVGDYDVENSARWIFHEACIKFNTNSSTWLAWAQLEAQQGHVGDYDIENSARWIFHEACMKFNNSSDIWLAWAQLEAQQNQVGDYDIENSARWIFRKICINHNASSNAWMAWAQLEAQQNQVGDYDIENSARWVFREACINHNADSNAWMAWAQLEAQQNQVGDYDIENSARWIFHEACFNHNADYHTWTAWAQLEAQQNQVGDYDIENSARWIFREACFNHNADGKTWAAWAQLEAQQNQVDDYDIENSARWIFHEACINRNADSNAWIDWAQLELSLHCVEKARNILRQSLQYSEHPIGRLAILEFFCGNINSEDPFCTNNLMLKMKKTTLYPFSIPLYLYYCNILLGRTKEAEEYHKQLLQKPEYDPTATSAEKFIQLCREALT